MIGTPNLSELYCSYEDEYIDAFKRFLHAGDFIGGNSIEHFEDALAKFLNKKYVVSCKSGTLFLLFLAYLKKYSYFCGLYHAYVCVCAHVE